MDTTVQESNKGLGLNPLSSARQMLAPQTTVQIMSVDDLDKAIQAIGKTYDIEDRRRRNKVVLRLFHRHHKGERQLRVVFASAILIGLGVEFVASLTAMYLIGRSYITISQWVAETFFVGVFTQVVTLATIVVNSLFPKPEKDMLTQLSEMINKY